MRQNMKKLIALVLACVLSMGLLPAMHVEASMAVFPFSLGGFSISIVSENMDPDNGIWDLDVYMGDPDSALTYFSFDSDYMAKYVMIVDGTQFPQSTWDVRDGKAVHNPQYAVYGFKVPFNTPVSGTETHEVKIYEKDSTGNLSLVFESHPTIYSLAAYNLHYGDTQIYSGGFDISLWNNQFTQTTWNGDVHMSAPDSCLNFFRHGQGSMQGYTMTVDG